jgi:hypothetical protein
MLVLFAVTTVQVSHFHPSGYISPDTTTTTSFSACDAYTPGGSCFICDYQLTKDADNSLTTAYLIHRNAGLHIAIAAVYTFTSQSIYPVFETRGPPVI